MMRWLGIAVPGSFVALAFACQESLGGTDQTSAAGSSAGASPRTSVGGPASSYGRASSGSVGGGPANGNLTGQSNPPGPLTSSGGAGGSSPDIPPNTSVLFIRANDNRLIETSCNGKDWKKANVEAPGKTGSAETDGFRVISQRGGLLLALGGGNDGTQSLQQLYTSEDGLTWKTRSTGNGNWLSGSGYLETPSGPLWIVGGGNGSRFYSRDRGVTWHDAPGGCTLRNMVSGGGRVVGFCDEGTAIGTPSPAGAADPVKWVMQDGNGDGWGHGAYGSGRVVGVWGGATDTPGCKVLVDGSDNWQSCNNGPADTVLFDSGWFYAATGNDKRWSQDGLTWSKRSEPEWIGQGGHLVAADNVYVRSDTNTLVATRVPASSCP